MSYGTVYTNPFRAGDTVTIPAGTPFIQNYDDRDTQTTKRATTITVTDIQLGCIRYMDRFDEGEEEKELIANPFGHTIVTTQSRVRYTLVHQPLIGKNFTGHNYRQYVITADLLRQNNITPALTQPVDLRG